MFGVELAIVGVTCLAAMVMLLTSPLWMRLLARLVRALWRQLAQTDSDVVVSNMPDDVVDGDYTEVDK